MRALGLCLALLLAAAPALAGPPTPPPLPSSGGATFNGGTVSGAITAPGFIGPLTGSVTGTASGNDAAGAAAAEASRATAVEALKAPIVSPTFTGPLTLGSWNTAGRPASPVTGMEGYNTDLGRRETWNGTAWVEYVRTTDTQPITAGGTGLTRAPYPTALDDYTTGNYPGMVWRTPSGAIYVNVSSALGQAVWQRQETFQLPGDAIGLFVDSIAVNAGGTGNAAGDVVTLQGGVQITLRSVVSGVITAPAFTASQAGTNLTVSAVAAGVLGAGEVLAGTGIAAPAAGLPLGEYIVSQTSGTAGGAGVYVVNVSATIGSEAMTASPVAISTPNMYGVCAPTTTASPQLATSGSGSGDTFNVGYLSPVLYAVRRATVCYTGPLLNVENSKTLGTQDIGYLADNSLDIATALAFGTSPNMPMERMLAFTDGATPNVAKWYDQFGSSTPGSNATAATQATVASQPVLFSGRKIGQNVAITFNAQNGLALPEAPTTTFLSIPTTVAMNSANITLLHLGGMISGTSAPIQLTGVGGSNTPLIGMYDEGPNYCRNTPTSGNGSSSTYNPFSADPFETPAVYGCAYNNGGLQVDSSYTPMAGWLAQIPTFVAGATLTTTFGTGTTCPLAANHAAVYAGSGADTIATALQGIANAINSDAVLQAAGIVAGPGIEQSGAGIAIYQPLGSNCTATFSASAGSYNSDWGTGPAGQYNSYFTATSNGGMAVAGGALSLDNHLSLSGYGYAGLDAIVPWQMTAPQMAAFRQSVHFHFGIDGHPGVIVMPLVASNMTGFYTPFLQDEFIDFRKQLGRDDAIVINRSKTGQSMPGNGGPVWTSTPTYYLPLSNYTTGRSSNQIGLVMSEFNSTTSTTPASPTTQFGVANQTVGSIGEYNAMQQVAGYFHAAGWKAICAPSYTASISAGVLANNAIIAATLAATPGNCDQVISPLTQPVFNQASGWGKPYFTGSGTHPAPSLTDALGSFWAEAVRSMVH